MRKTGRANLKGSMNGCLRKENCIVIQMLIGPYCPMQESHGCFSVALTQFVQHLLPVEPSHSKRRGAMVGPPL